MEQLLMVLEPQAAATVGWSQTLPEHPVPRILVAVAVVEMEILEAQRVQVATVVPAS